LSVMYFGRTGSGLFHVLSLDRSVSGHPKPAREGHLKTGHLR